MFDVFFQRLAELNRITAEQSQGQEQLPPERIGPARATAPAARPAPGPSGGSAGDVKSQAESRAESQAESQADTQADTRADTKADTRAELPDSVSDAPAEAAAPSPESAPERWPSALEPDLSPACGADAAPEPEPERAEQAGRGDASAKTADRPIAVSAERAAPNPTPNPTPNATSSGAAARSGGRLTQRQIAKALGLSPATVSMALRDDPLVAPETRARVKAAAAEGGYLYNAAAGALRNGRTGVIGLALDAPRVDAALLDALERRFAEAGCAVLTAFHRGSAARAAEIIADFAGRAVEGAILLRPNAVAPEAADAALEPLRAAGAAALLIDPDEARAAPSAGAAVGPEAAAMRLAVERALALGRRRFVLVGGAHDAPEAEARARAYRNALSEAGVPWEGQLWIRGAGAAERALQSPTPPDALIAWDVETGLNALAAARRLDRAPGGDLSVIAFGAPTDGLTVARPVRADLAARLLAEIRPEQGRETGPAALILGGSCGGAPVSAAA